MDAQAVPPQLILIHYAEIGLKGENRRFFERQLMRNIEAQLDGLDVAGLKRMSGRLLLRLGESRPVEAVTRRLAQTFGIAYVAPAYGLPRDVEAMKEVIGRRVRQRAFASFKVATRRTDKRFPLTSVELNREIGAHVQHLTGAAVNLRRPELTIHIEILYDSAFFYFERIPGPGGLPVGVSGLVGVMLSGGIDSPVAAWYALKRGCRVLPIHFHSGPFGNWMAAADKARALVVRLAPWGAEPHLYVVPIGEIQRRITLLAPAEYRVLLYRRLMVRVAGELTRRHGGKALVTGDNLGQVASQTLESLTVVNAAAGTMPILRPLIGLDKQEIIERARAIGTYETSILPGEDCCSFLMPRRVATRPTLEAIEEAESRLDVAAMVSEALDRAVLEPTPRPHPAPG